MISLGPRGQLVDSLEAAEIPVTCLNAKGLFSLPSVLFQLIRELRRLRPQVVQTFLFHANILGRFAARFAEIPIVVSGLRVAEHRSQWYGCIDRWTNFLVKTNVCVSHGVADFAEQSEGLPRSKLVVIPNSVDADRFMTARPADLTSCEIPAGSLVLIAIGRLDHQKGIDILIDSLQFIDVIEAHVHVLIVGEGSEANDLRARAAKSKHSSRIHFANRRDDVPQLLAASYALILPSRWEGMPNVVLEAMAAGLPVIATRVEGIAELIRDHVNGLIIAPENPSELADAITWILSHPEFRMGAQSESQAIIQKQFTQDCVTEAYAAIYRSLMRG